MHICERERGEHAITADNSYVTNAHGALPKPVDNSSKKEEEENAEREDDSIAPMAAPLREPLAPPLSGQATARLR